MHAIEKILARAAGKEAVVTGEIVNCRVDLAGINDLYLQTVRSFEEMGGKKVRAPEKVVVFFDHYAPASTIVQAENHRNFRKFCEEQQIDKLMDINQGVCHQVIADHGLNRPGEIVVVTDSHTTTHGAFGAFGTGVGATDMAIILLTGELWFRVPEIMRIHLEGTLSPGVFAKDVILHVIGQLGADYGVYQAVEFTGPLLASLSVSERMALCNMTTEMGAKTCYIQPDEITKDFFLEKGITHLEIVESDPGYRYAAEHHFDVTGLTPQVAAPHSVDNVFALHQYLGKKVDQAYLGTCTGGRVADIEVAARILAGRKVHPRTRFLVVPASRDVLLEAMALGYVQTLVQAGATFVTPGCAACLGTHQGMLTAGETCITSANRNFPGRMGHTEAEIYLASPAAVAAAAAAGEIVDPALYLP
ncbi:MAG: 3-isopropylmalate dehydratase large subunit [Desulfuromonadales bacterium]|nr:3-isopropylmalate dehydratase large subunit [Desulfuromonadales bacterium]